MNEKRDQAAEWEERYWIVDEGRSSTYFPILSPLEPSMQRRTSCPGEARSRNPMPTWFVT